MDKSFAKVLHLIPTVEVWPPPRHPSWVRAALPYLFLTLLSGLVSAGVVHLRQERAGLVCVGGK